MCAIRLPHNNLLTFHTMLNIYYHNLLKLLLQFYMIVVVMWFGHNVICLAKEVTISQM